MDSVKSAVSAYFDALNSSDVEGLVSVFTEDGALMGHEMETLRGQEQIRRAFQGIFQGVSFQRELHFDEVQESEGTAIARTHSTGTITILANDHVDSPVSRELFVLRKSADGWRITDYMFNRTGPAQ